jgi:hypothetical protein
VNITNAIVRILAEALAISNGILNTWVNMPANVVSPLDLNATASASGNDLVRYLASSAVKASDIMCVVVNALF